MTRAYARVSKKDGEENVLSSLLFIWLRTPEKLQNFKSCAVNGLITLGDDLILRGCKADGDTGILGILIAHGSRTEA